MNTYDIIFQKISRIRISCSISNLLTGLFIGIAIFFMVSYGYDSHAQPLTEYIPSPSKVLLERASFIKQTISKNSKDTIKEKDFLNLISVYQRALRLDKENTISDTLLIAQAEIYQQMGVKFNKPRYFYSAIQCYADVVEHYSTSSYVAHGLVNMAQIYEQDLLDVEGATKIYADIIKRYPQSVTARESKAALARLGGVVGDRNPQNVVEANFQTAGDRESTINQIRHFSGPDYARVILDLSIPVNYERKLNGNTLVLKLPKTILSSSISTKQITVGSGGLLKQIRLNSSTNSNEVSIDCTHIRDFAIFALDNPPRIVADVRGARSIAEDAEEITPPISQSAQQTADGSMTLLRALGLKVKCIVIDPGHGGSDTGAIGKDGICEKDVVLDVALRLRTIIQQQMKETQIIMTRETDVYIPLEERTAIANSKQADLFISIHANSSPSSSATGVETYFLSLDASKEELEVAARENATTSRSAGELQALLQKIVLDNKVTESHDFAQHIQKSLVTGLVKRGSRSSFNRGVKKAPFVVLLGTNMPSILAEISFISNPKDADSLRTVEFRQHIAESLFDGIHNYTETLSKGTASSGTN